MNKFRNNSELSFKKVPARVRNSSKSVPNKFRNSSKPVPKEFRNGSNQIRRSSKQVPKPKSETDTKTYRSKIPNRSESVPTLFRNKFRNSTETSSEKVPKQFRHSSKQVPTKLRQHSKQVPKIVPDYIHHRPVHSDCLSVSVSFQCLCSVPDFSALDQRTRGGMWGVAWGMGENLIQHLISISLQF